MSQSTTAVIDRLRQSRDFTDLLDEIRKDSFEERIDQIRSLVEGEQSRVVLATFRHHVIFEQNGGIFRGKVVESQSNGDLSLAEIEQIDDVAVPSGTPDELQQEVFETARAAVDDILSEDGDPKPKFESILHALHTSDGHLYTHLSLGSILESFNSGEQWWRNFLKTSESVVREHTRGEMEEILSEAPASRYADIEMDALQDKSAQLKSDLKHTNSVLQNFAQRLSDAVSRVEEGFEGLPSEGGLAIVNFQRFAESLGAAIDTGQEAISLALESDLTEQAQTYETLVSVYPEMAQAVVFVERVIEGGGSE